MSKKRKLYYELTVNDWNKQIEQLELFNIPHKVYINGSTIRLCTRKCTYKASLSLENQTEISPANISKAFHKETKYHYIERQYGYHKKYISDTNSHKILWDYKTACGYTMCSKEHTHKWLKCWSYDINSAYPYAMLKDMPDTTKEPRYNDIVKEHEIGFFKNGSATIDVGDFADIIFPLTKSPFIDYVNKYYKLKQTATGDDRKIWKYYLNIPTGCVQRHNIFLRNAIIYYSNKYIKQFIDDNTVYCNIDCIISLNPRPDIPLGDEVGLFKEEHINDNFKYIACGIYQWNSECHYRGINDKYIEDIEDVPEDWHKQYMDSLDYTYNESTRRIEQNGKKETLD